MIESNVPGRLIAIASRDRGYHALANAFPGASVPTDVANTQIRAETNHGRGRKRILEQKLLPLQIGRLRQDVDKQRAEKVRWNRPPVPDERDEGLL